MIQALEEKLSFQEAKDVQLSSQISLSTSELRIDRQNAQDSVAKALYNEGRYKFGERIAIETYERRKELQGSDDPSTVESIELLLRFRTALEHTEGCNSNNVAKKPQVPRLGK